MADNLSRYILQVSRLIRDRSHLAVSTDELTDYINQARDDVAKITGCLRCLIAGNAPFGGGATPGLAIPGGATPGAADTTITTFQTLPGVEKYTYGYAGAFLRAQYTGVRAIADVIDVAVSWGSASRPVMEWESWEVLQALGRIYSVGVFSYPFKAAKQGEGVNQAVFLFPVPSQNLEMEWDVTCLPNKLYTDNDAEAIPEPYTDAIQYLAAAYCFMTTQRFSSAELMKDRGYEKLGIDRAASGRGEVPSYYDFV